jgi:LysM repeat protein
LVSNELTRALIIDTGTGASFSVMYNPEELKVEQGNNFAEVGIPGLNAPPLQYVRGKARVLTMELFFDTYETGEDVRNHTGPVVQLLETQPVTKAPPVLLFSLGRVQFRCVLVDASQRFTMFLRDGTPVRSTMSVRLQEFVDVDVEIRQGLFFGSPTVSAALSAIPGVAAVSGTAAAAVATVHVTAQGETLSGIAAAYLGDAGRWRQIADANKIDDPFDLPPGRSLVIPPSAGGATGPRS